SAADMERDFLHLHVGQRFGSEQLMERLVNAGYTRQPLAEKPGEVSLRGDILDVYPFAAELPVRLELFDEELESIRTYDPGSQRSVEIVKHMALSLVSDAGGVEDGDGSSPWSMLSRSTIVVELEPLRLAEQAEGMRVRSTAHQRALAGLREWSDKKTRLSLQSLPAGQLGFDSRSIQKLSVGMHDAARALGDATKDGTEAFVLCRTDGEAQRVIKLLGDDLPHVHVRLGGVARGFRLLDPPLIVLDHHELAGVLGTRRQAPERKKHDVRALESFFELKRGDLTVHAVHGVGRFIGLERMERAGGEEEHLRILFADEVTVYVPVSRIDLVQRYVGSGSSAPPLDKVGGHAFRRRKEKVEKALFDLAAELLEVQAKRELKLREPWVWDQDMVDSMLSAFPYESTSDQVKADGEIAGDMGSGAPMDRLLCGDVGFGKTEVAMRAAFRAVSAGAQVALLVPTTVLAAQHLKTFCARFADFPITVEGLSRYVTGKKAKDIVARASRGQVDILIGTHRILSKDVELPKLGLVIIDEEQRFGVKHKEHFKTLRAQVDLLTLSATPIPRTLHMSLSGLRDISALAEPPIGRQEIETVLIWQQDVDKIREAMLREHTRGGQTFFLHNRVQSIERRAREMRALVPECRYAIGHGQMGGKALKQVMDSFISGETECLMATTIIENGVDVPTAGTILIDEADMFGLSELHQLRGRVGRGSHKAYCYLLLDKTKPMRDVARKRLKALEELTHLGAGFQISMKDLEIRGAGNLLGPQQSGHIAAIGYDMYCRLLQRTVERLRLAPDPNADGVREELARLVPAEVTADIEAAAVEIELGVRAFLPSTWIKDVDERLELLRELNRIHTDGDANDALTMLRDRFGRVPQEAKTLVSQFRFRARLAELGIRRLLYREDVYVLEYSDRITLEEALAGKRAELRPMASGKAHLVLPPKKRTAKRAWEWIAGLLQ
ncbi:MAG: transcription-repair coupling factor (superfamily II helicase), partial [Planctomycetota bacterium]